jgi:nucleoid-associated protein YgaU
MKTLYLSTGMTTLILLLSSGASAGNAETSSPTARAEVSILRTHVDSMTQRLAAANVELSRRHSTAAPGRLELLERRAVKVDALQEDIRLKKSLIESLSQAAEEARGTITQQATEIARLCQVTNDMAMAHAELAARIAPTERALRMLRSGNFEYYTVKQGDTCMTIAAKATIYGEAGKQILIRQANHGKVDDLDTLTPGEVLVIPRYPESGTYEF